jgi:transcriptional regulator
MSSMSEPVEVPDYDERAREIQDKTILSGREADVRALKEHGYTHQEIADILGISKGAVDRYSARTNERIEKIKNTIELLDLDLDE